MYGKFFRKPRRGLRPLRKSVTKKKIYRRGKKANAGAVVALNRKVNKLVRSVETKFKRQEGSINLGGPANTNFDQQIWSITPCTTTTDPKCIDIQSGDGQDQRSGNKITTKANWLNFTLMLNPYEATTNLAPKPVIVKYWVVSVRGSQFGTTNVDVENLIKTRFFQANASYTGFSDSPMDNIREINKDVFIVHQTREFKLGNQYIQSSSSGTVNNNAQRYANNDFKMFYKFRLNLTKYTSKQVRYNDNDGSSFNKMKWVFFTVANADGTFVSDQLPVFMFWNRIYKFTDM